MHCRRWASSCFLLVIALSRQHLALAALPLVRSSEESSSEAYSVVWSSPAPGDRFGPGDTIVGEWQVTPQKVVSPSFRLCAGGEDGCGATVWPEVVEESEGSYYASLTAPTVSTESGYYLQMKDDFGHAFSSPIFNITPSPQKKNKPAAHPPDVAQPRPEQAPMSSSPSPSSSTGTKSKGDTTESDPAAVPAAAPENPNGILSSPSAASSVSPNSAAPSIPPGGNINSGSGGPQVAAAHNAPPTAALAVPLSLAGAIILLAGGLALHHRRRLAAEKQRSWSKAAQLIRGGAGASDIDDDDVAASESALLRRMRSHSSRLAILHLGGNRNSRRDNGNHRNDVEKALFAGALFGGAAAALPDHHAHNAYYDRCRSHDYAPSYAYGTLRPQPRQRTRELDLLSQEFTTSTGSTARPRPRAHPSRSPSSSSSSYRGLWGGRGYSVRRSATGNTNGGGAGSLWRSLSFAAARPKKQPPRVSRVPAPSSLNSPAMATVMSVTSEVLPSYLPSPTLVGDVADQARVDEHGAGVGDLGFEDVPLSPPLPSPLHTRGEAADPDDSRMRELRDVYEAVSRALGSAQRV